MELQKNGHKNTRRYVVSRSLKLAFLYIPVAQTGGALDSEDSPLWQYQRPAKENTARNLKTVERHHPEYQQQNYGYRHEQSVCAL
jgi:hypothetical protein